MFLTKLGLTLITPFRGLYYKKHCDSLTILNHELKRALEAVNRQNREMSERYKEAHEMKRNFIDLQLERDQWKQRALAFMEPKASGITVVS